MSNGIGPAPECRRESVRHPHTKKIFDGAGSTLTGPLDPVFHTLAATAGGAPAVAALVPGLSSKAACEGGSLRRRGMAPSFAPALLLKETGTACLSFSKRTRLPNRFTGPGQSRPRLKARREAVTALTDRRPVKHARAHHYLQAEALAQACHPGSRASGYPGPIGLERLGAGECGHMRRQRAPSVPSGTMGPGSRSRSAGMTSLARWKSKLIPAPSTRPILPSLPGADRGAGRRPGMTGFTDAA